VKEQATRLLRAFASSDLETIDQLCDEDVLLWGTDAAEVWRGKAAVLTDFAGAFDLGVSWAGEPVIRDDWVAGEVEFVLANGAVQPARVTMVFRAGFLTHAHYSVALKD
jgi:hypothetical protein